MTLYSPGTPSIRKKEIITNHCIFKSLPDHRLSEIALALQELTFGERKIIISRKAILPGLYIITSGKAESKSRDGKPSLQLESGNFFGCPYIHPRSSSNLETMKHSRMDIISITAVTCLFLPFIHYNLLQELFHVPESKYLSSVETILSVESLELDLTRSPPLAPDDIRYPRVFGGQLLGQALATAFRSVDPDLTVHSLHSYFLVAGDPKVPIIYRVERIRDGQSFSTRHVLAIQKGRNIFSMHASFQRHEVGLEHQMAMPDCPPPEQVPSLEDLQQAYLFDARVPLNVREARLKEPPPSFPVDARIVDPGDWVDPDASDPRQLIWMKVRGHLSPNRAMNCCALAFASDYLLLGTSLLAHGVSTHQPDLTMASIDHCMWFHKPFKADDWLLYQVESPRSAGSRGFCSGHIFNQSGELVVSVAQEGLIRLKGYSHNNRSRL